MGEYHGGTVMARPAQRRPSRMLPVIVAVLTVGALIAAGAFVVRRATRPVTVDGSAAPIHGAQATTTATTSAAPGGVHVSLAPALSGSQHADEVIALFTRYFVAINTRDYQQWVSTLSTDRVPDSDAKFSDDYSTTSDEQVRIQDIVETDDGGLEVVVSFRSHQAEQKAPKDAPYDCLDWQMRYPLSREAGALKLGFVPPANRSYMKCR
jgi:hypothetical protein